MPYTVPSTENTRVALPALPINRHGSEARLLTHACPTRTEKCKTPRSMFVLYWKRKYECTKDVLQKNPWGEEGGHGPPSCKLAEQAHRWGCDGLYRHQQRKSPFPQTGTSTPGSAGPRDFGDLHPQ